MENVAERVEFTGYRGLRLVGDRWAPTVEPKGQLLLLHGGGQTRHSWAATGQRLAARGWSALALDARGHGDSDWAGGLADYDLDSHIADLRAVIAALGEPPAVIGASMGGLAAMLAEGRHPGLVRALVLVDVTPTLERVGVTKIHDFMRAGLSGFDNLDEVADAVAAYNPHRPRPRSVHGLRKNLRQRDDGRWYWHWDPAMVADVGDDYDRGIPVEERRRLAAAVRVPTLLVRGGHSDVVSAAGAQELLELIPGSQLAAAEGAGHMVAGDDNDVFTAEVERFLSELPPRIVPVQEVTDMPGSIEGSGQGHVLRRTAGRAALVRSAAVMTGYRVVEKLSPKRLRLEPGAVPASLAELTPEWLTHALCRDHPGAAVVDFSTGPGSDGTSARRPLVVTYNDAGSEAGLPTALYTKTSPTLPTRFFVGLNHFMVFENQFYLKIRPELPIEAPRALHAAWDVRSGRSILILEDIVVARGVTFGDPRYTTVSREQAEDMVDLMATYHAAFWDSPRLENEFTWLLDYPTGQRRMNDYMWFQRMYENGIRRSRDLMPGSLVKREKELWPALLRSLETEVGRPQTLLHEDTHSRNWYFTGEGRMGLYDWQASGKGCWAVDVAYALAAGLTIENRRAWERDLLDRYLDRLGPLAPPSDQAWTSYRQQLIHGVGYWFATIGRLLVQPEFQPHDVTAEHIRRLTQAAEDIGTLDALRG